MPKTYKITAENALELREAMNKKENVKYYKRLLAVALRERVKITPKRRKLLNTILKE